MMDKEASYLDQLKFDPSLSKNILAKYLTNIRLVILLLIAIVVFGIASFSSLPRRLNPQVEFPIVTIVTVLPGASPEDIESLVTIPIEDELEGLKHVETISSQSQDNVSVITIEFESNSDPDKANDDVQATVDSVVDLPEDAETPQVIKLDVENQPIWTFALTAGEDVASLMRFAETLEEKIEELPTIDRVELAGLEEEEIQVLLKPEAQREFKVDALALSQKVHSAISSYPAGSVNTKNSSFSLTIDPTVNSIEELRNLQVDAGTRNIALSQIAEVSRKSKPSQSNTYLASNEVGLQKSVILNVFKASTANIDVAAEDARKVVEETLADFKNQFRVSTTMDLAELIGEQYDDLASSFKLTILLVFLILFIFLGIRQASTVSLAIPLSFLVAFAVMNTVGLTLNFISLFALILTLGLLVDTAIVIVTAITTYFRTGKFTPQEAGLLALRDFAAPIWATTITTVWAFLPLLISSGILGEFIKSMPIVVSSAILASASLSILITLPLMMVILKPKIPQRVKTFLLILALAVLTASLASLLMGNPFLPFIVLIFIILLLLIYKIHQAVIARILAAIASFFDIRPVVRMLSQCIDRGAVGMEAFSEKYQRFIEGVLSSRTARRKTVLAVVVFSLFSYLLVPLGFVVNEFFPKTDQDQVFVNLELPPGTNLETTEEEGIEIIKVIQKTKGLESVTAQMGVNLDPEFMNAQGAENGVVYILNLKEQDQREQTSIEIARSLRSEFKDYNRGELSVIELTGGPPVGADLQIELLGDDLGILERNADKIIEYLKTQEGATNIKKSIEARTSKIVFVPSRPKIDEAGISEAQIGLALRTFASGFTLDSVRFEERLGSQNSEEMDIVFRNNDVAENPETLSIVHVPTSRGQVPILSLGEFLLQPNPTLITRENDKRTISVSAGVLSDFSVSTLNKNLENFADTLKLPAGYEWQTGGLSEENQEAVNDVLKGMVMAAILILATMVILLGSYRKAVIVLLVIPLAISGVFIVFALSGTPLTFPTIVGLLALFGIVVNNSILIVYKINQNLDLKMRLKHAISDASASRVAPIFFSSLTTIVGLIPITLSNPLWQGLGGAIIAGLIFSGSIMLLFIPVVYFMIFEKEEKEGKDAQFNGLILIPKK